MAESLVFKAQTANFTSVPIVAEDTAEIRRQLAEKLAHAPAGFFQGAPMVADLDAITHGDLAWLFTLKETFREQGLLLIGLRHHRFSAKQLFEAGLADIPAGDSRGTAPGKGQSQENSGAKAADAQTPPPHNTVIRKTIRSGQRVYARGGDLTVIGTVGAGAEVIADGNIYILGSLRGRAFAGAQGEESAHIFCNELSAELVSIAGNYQNMEQLEAYKALKNGLITLNKDETMCIVSL